MKNFIDGLKRINWKDIPVATYVRYILMLISVVNIVLTHFGVNPIQISESTLYQTVSDLLTVAILIVNTWYNNSVTPEAIEADKVMIAAKNERKNA